MNLNFRIFLILIASGLMSACQTTEEKFVQANKADLSLEMAQGEGQKLERLAAAHGCQSPESKAAFKQMAQTSYGQIYSSGGESSGKEILQNLRAELMGWNEVNALCGAPTTAEAIPAAAVDGAASPEKTVQ